MTVIFKIIYFEVFLCTYDGLQKEYYIYIYIYIYVYIYLFLKYHSQSQTRVKEHFTKFAFKY
jgi:hypothetical protein